MATSRALAAALGRLGPFDLVLLGRNSLDADTDQVPPQLAALLGLPFLVGVGELRLDRRNLQVRRHVGRSELLVLRRLTHDGRRPDPARW